MKGILINAKDHTITKVDISVGYQVINQLLGSRCFTVALDLPNGDCVYVDDEGMFTAEDFFSVEGGYQPYAGNGLVVGTGAAGDTISAKSTLMDIQKAVTFQSRARLQAQYA